MPQPTRCAGNIPPRESVLVLRQASIIAPEGTMSLTSSRVPLMALLCLLSMAIAACDDPGNQADPASTKVVLTPDPTATAVPVVSEATLPTLTLTHEGRAVDARRYEGCWRPDPSADFQCVGTSPHGELGNYLEVESGEVIEIEITPDSRPTKLMATIFTQPGEVMVSDLLHLSPVERELVVEMPPGRYNVRLHAQWFEGGSEIHHKVNYVFGLRVPGEPELKGGCTSTAIGGILGIVLESVDDQRRTAVEAINSMGCGFNKPMAEVRLFLESDSGHTYTETFQLEPPSLIVQFPVPEDVSSVREGGPLPAGEYSRRIVVVAEDGTEQEFRLGDIGGIVKLVDELPEADAPVQFPQHPDGKRTYTNALPDHIEGRLQVHRGCIYIRNGTIPVWPSDFTMRLVDDLVQIVDEGGNVVGVDGEEAVLAGYEVRADLPAGKEISATLPLACPPGNFWIVGDEIGELKERARMPIVSLEGSSLIFHRQYPSRWSDDLSISTEGELVHEGDCLRLNDAARHMIIWPPLFTPHMENGMVEVRDGDGLPVARVGDTLELTGFGSALMRPHYVDTCPGPYWTVGRIKERR